jgi:hypothetical protein
VTLSSSPEWVRGKVSGLAFLPLTLVASHPAFRKPGWVPGVCSSVIICAHEWSVISSHAMLFIFPSLYQLGSQGQGLFLLISSIFQLCLSRKAFEGHTVKVEMVFVLSSHF